MAKVDGIGANSLYRLSHYAISNLLDVLITARANKSILEVGYTPVLIIKRQRIEIDGPDVTTEAMNEILHGVATTRQIRSLRRDGIVEFVLTHKQREILAQFIDAFDV